MYKNSKISQGFTTSTQKRPNLPLSCISYTITPLLISVTFFFCASPQQTFPSSRNLLSPHFPSQTLSSAPLLPPSLAQLVLYNPSIPSDGGSISTALGSASVTLRWTGKESVLFCHSHLFWAFGTKNICTTSQTLRLQSCQQDFGSRRRSFPIRGRQYF